MLPLPGQVRARPHRNRQSSESDVGFSAKQHQLREETARRRSAAKHKTPLMRSVGAARSGAERSGGGGELEPPFRPSQAPLAAAEVSRKLQLKSHGSSRNLY